MFKSQWLLALPLVLASTIASTAQAATIRDQAGMFSPEAVSQASARLERTERESRMPVTIETVDSLNGESIDQAVIDHAKRAGARGLYFLIAKREHRIEGAVSPEFRRVFSTNRILGIRRAFAERMKAGDADGALEASAAAIGREVSQARAAAPVPGVPQRARPRSSGLGSLLTIGLLIVGGLFLFRLLGNLFGARRGYGAPGQMGGPGYGPGYGGGGGGFMSSMFGGIGGALAGNWLYDQFSGRHHGGSTDSTSYGDQGVSDAGGDWATPGDGGGDWGGGGGDVGGGGDWGGGGGDGGGGDW
jgi:uncharacterized protein